MGQVAGAAGRGAVGGAVSLEAVPREAVVCKCNNAREEVGAAATAAAVAMVVVVATEMAVEAMAEAEAEDTMEDTKEGGAWDWVAAEKVVGKRVAAGE